MILIVIFGSIYILLGVFSLLISLLFIELDRPKDLIKSGLMITLGIFFIIYKNSIAFSAYLILTLQSILLSFYIVENYLFRWNQLLEREKKEITSFKGFLTKSNLYLTIIKDGLKNLFLKNSNKNILKNNSIQKKWVREKDTMNDSTATNANLKEYKSNDKTTFFTKEDIISDEKSPKKNIISDK
tara:strand:+ start:111 stop:665 length:555 start_codon:yes stop_codon:yes gene_type:complete